MYIYGRKPVEEALRANRAIEKIFFMYGAGGSAIDALRRMAKAAGIACSVMDKRKFLALERAECGGRDAAQGVIALIAPVQTLTVTQLIEQAYERTELPVLVALDGISDPHNLGAIARSAECAGLHGLIIPERRSAPLTGTAVKISAGALNFLPVAKTGSLTTALVDAHNAGFRIIGSSDKADAAYSELAYDSPAVIVIGSEGTGMQPAITQLCDILTCIPMGGKVSSLNASVAAGVIFFEIQRQRLAAAKNAVHT